MSAKHTPGPWGTLTFSNHELQTDFAMVKIGSRAHMVGYSGEDKANARLIAAAPELLAALKQVAMWLSIMTETAGLDAEETQVELSEFADDPNRHPETISIASSLEKARAAIAKAIG